ncbi:MAG: glutamate 5-kinase [Candidatus Omnitrophica bacterium]|nr:glutamate 5-kinase [Candidatus Omnitrophota bacterium]
MSKKKAKRITVKIGTRVLTDKNNRIDRDVIKNLSRQMASLMDKGIEVVLVSSGAIGAGLGLLDLKKKGRSLSELQAIASVGQNHLMDIYNEHLGKKGYVAGQILLTREDFNDRKRFLNIRYTLNTLLKYRAIPIINENDSISTDEIKFGDNDRISSLVADLASSDMLVILTDVEGLYDQKGKLIRHVDLVTGKIKALCRGKGCEESAGGMISKLDSVRNAAQAGIEGVIARGREKDVLLRVADGEDVGTRFDAHEKPLRARKRWIAFGRKPRGKVMVDEGAEKALIERNKSLLPSGVVAVKGNFADGDVVEVVGKTDRVIARGLSNYTSEEMKKIMGKKSQSIEEELGYKDYDEVIHRDNLVIFEES